MAKWFPVFGEENQSEMYNPEELIDLFLDNTADGIAIVDMEGRFIRVNRMYTEIFGYTEEDVIGKSCPDESIPDRLKGIIVEVKKGNSIHNMITQSIHKSGAIIDVAVSYSPFRNIDGEIIAVIGVYRDITERINIERELARTRELYRLIAENTTDLIMVVTNDKEIVYASPSYEKAIGMAPEEMIGKSFMDFVCPEEKEFNERIFQQLLHTKEPLIFQHKLELPEGELFAEYNISPIFNEKNEIESFVSVGRNITERVKNDEVMRNLDRLSIIGQLAAGVAHEIRNPLTSLKGFSKLLKDLTDKEKQEYYLSIITNELDRIDMIVNEFMSLAKPQAIQFQPVNLLSIIESTVNILHPQAILHNVEIKNHFRKNDIEILCSRNQLKQVFVNFLKNAIEAMPNGGQVHIRVKKIKGGGVQICITDEGVGIDAELMHYLGTPFYTTKDKGIGLGLTVSNKIIQEHGGTMKIDSQIGQGTTVTLELQCI